MLKQARQNALSISITAKTSRRQTQKPCFLIRDTHVEMQRGETSFLVCIASKKATTNWIHDFLGGPSFEFFFFLFLETQWQFSYLIFDFPFIPIFGTSFWSWKHRFGFDGVGSKRAYMRDTIQKVFPCCQPSRDLRSSRLESLKAKILSNSGKRTSFLEKKGLEK